MRINTLSQTPVKYSENLSLGETHGLLVLEICSTKYVFINWKIRNQAENSQLEKLKTKLKLFIEKVGNQAKNIQYR